MTINRKSVMALIGAAITSASLMLAVPASADRGHDTTASSSDSGSGSIRAPKANATNPGRVGTQWVIPGWDEGM